MPWELTNTAKTEESKQDAKKPENTVKTVEVKQETKKLGIVEMIPGMILAIAAAIAMIIGAYFFSATKIKTETLLSINISPLTKAILTPEFAFFIIGASVAIALILLIGKKYDFTYATIFGAAGYALGAVISLLLFSISDFILPIAVGLIAIPVGLKFLNEKEQEFKYLKTARAGSSAAGRIITMVCIIFTLYLLATTYTQKDTLREQFVPEMLKMTVGEAGIPLSDTLTSQLAEAIAEQQKGTVDLMLDQPEIKRLQAKGDPDGAGLVQKLDDLKTQFSGNEFKQQIINNLKRQDIDVGGELIKKFPIINFLAEYAWLIYPIIALLMMLFIGGAFVKNIAALIYGATTLLFKGKQANSQKTVENKAN